MELYQAISFIAANAVAHAGKQPTLGTLLEEVAELARALEGKHEHPPTLELIQIGGIVANMLTRYSWTDASDAIQARAAAAPLSTMAAASSPSPAAAMPAATAESDDGGLT